MLKLLLVGGGGVGVFDLGLSWFSLNGLLLLLLLNFLEVGVIVVGLFYVFGLFKFKFGVGEGVWEVGGG